MTFLFPGRLGFRRAAGAGMLAVLLSSGGLAARADDGAVPDTATFSAGEAARGEAWVEVVALVTVPVVTSPLVSAGTVGAPYAYQLTANVSPATFSVTGLPAGLRLDPATARILGRPATAGTFPVRLEAFGDVAADSRFVRSDDLVIAEPVVTPAVITSPPLAPATVGAPYSFRLTANVSPVTFSVAGLPPGLRADPRSGLISGSPTAAGSFPVRLEAVGERVGDTIVVLYQTLVVGPVPVVVPAITSPPPPAGVVGMPYVFRVTSSVPTATFVVAGLPAGLAMDAATGLIRGTPRVAGTYALSLTAVSTKDPDSRFTVSSAMVISQVGGVGTSTLFAAGEAPRTP